MIFHKFRKISSFIIVSLFALAQAQVLSAASYNRTPSASMSSQQKTCRSVSEIFPLLKRGNVLLFGEIHGTQEIPAFIADVVCMAAKKQIPVTLGLEIPYSEQKIIDRFLDSRGGKEAEARLIEGAFWHSKTKDGRSSLAMLRLIEQVRTLRAAGAKVQIVAYDSDPLAQERDRIMAQNLSNAIAGKPKNLFIVLSGNNHTRLTRGNQWNKEFESMGYLLAKSNNGSQLFSLNMSHEGGEAWICIEEPPDFNTVCKAKRLKPYTGAPAAWSVKLTAEANTPYSGAFGVGVISASPPVHQ